MSNAAVWALIPAAGKGSRMRSEIPKQYLELHGKAILEHTVNVLSEHPSIAGTVIVISADDTRFENLMGDLPTGVRTVHGGAERCHSVLAGLDAIADNAGDNDWVMVHDAARPCLRASDIGKMITSLSDDPVGGILAVPVRDTLKRGNSAAKIVQTVDRTDMWHALTPQMFRLGVLRSALRSSIESGRLVTDEAQAIEEDGLIPTLVEGAYDNIKITRPADLTLAEIFLNQQGR